jgi:uncharacterized protein
MRHTAPLRRYAHLGPLIFVLAAAVLFAASGDAWPGLAPARLQAGRFPNFVTMFLGIFMEATPFLLAGSLVSGLIAVYVDQKTLLRWLPRHPLLAVFSGAILGLAFPVCECGIVPVVRRLYQKGAPLPVGVAFLLAAPIVNPVVLASTVTAFGWGAMFAGRVLLGLGIASGVALLFYLARPAEVLRPRPAPGAGPESEPRFTELIGVADGRQAPGRGQPMWDVLAGAGHDFADMARYLIIGSMLAAGIQTLLPQSLLLNVGSDPFLSIVSMMSLAFLLSLCSTVDAFIALSFVNNFSSAAILSFLVFGPMMDVKSTLMLLSVFRRRVVLYLVLLPLTIMLAVAVYLNLNVAW